MSLKLATFKKEKEIKIGEFEAKVRSLTGADEYEINQSCTQVKNIKAMIAERKEKGEDVDYEKYVTVDQAKVALTRAARAMVVWNLVDDAEVALPITVENMGQLPHPYLEKINEEILALTAIPKDAVLKN